MGKGISQLCMLKKTFSKILFYPFEKKRSFQAPIKFGSGKIKKKKKKPPGK
jgi:hypothetical protein